MYQRGTLEEFNQWHEKTKLAYGFPPGGIVGLVNGRPAPNNQRTVNYVESAQKPDKSNDHIWPHGAYPDGDKVKLTLNDIKNLNWFSSE